jgi:hypothetical protein
MVHYGSETDVTACSQGGNNMKINPCNQTQPLVNKIAAGSKGAAKANSFNQIFEETVGQKKTASVSNQPMISFLRGPSMDIPISGEAAVIDSIGSVLDNLEQYQQMLGDTHTSLRAMETTVNRMKEDADSLESLLAGLPEDDTAKPIMEDTLMLVAKEIARFEQGDYVD